MLSIAGGFHPALAAMSSGYSLLMSFIGKTVITPNDIIIGKLKNIQDNLQIIQTKLEQAVETIKRESILQDMRARVAKIKALNIIYESFADGKTTILRDDLAENCKGAPMKIVIGWFYDQLQPTQSLHNVITQHYEREQLMQDSKSILLAVFEAAILNQICLTARHYNQSEVEITTQKDAAFLGKKIEVVAKMLYDQDHILKTEFLKSGKMIAQMVIKNHRDLDNKKLAPLISEAIQKQYPEYEWFASCADVVEKGAGYYTYTGSRAAQFLSEDNRNQIIIAACNKGVTEDAHKAFSAKVSQILYPSTPRIINQKNACRDVVHLFEQTKDYHLLTCVKDRTHHWTSGVDRVKGTLWADFVVLPKVVIDGQYIHTSPALGSELLKTTSEASENGFSLIAVMATVTKGHAKRRLHLG